MVVVVAAADVGTAPKLFASLLAFLPPTNQRPILGAIGGKIINFLGHMISIWGGLIYIISISSLISLLFPPYSSNDQYFSCHFSSKPLVFIAVESCRFLQPTFSLKWVGGRSPCERSPNRICYM